MAYFNAGSYSFRVATGETRYPLRSTPDGTTTAGSSDFISAGGIVIESVIVADGAATTLTLSDHDGTAGTDILLNIPATDGVTIPLGPNGIQVPWKGIRAVAGAGAGLAVIVVFRCS